jgi:hypothetical protein
MKHIGDSDIGLCSVDWWDQESELAAIDKHLLAPILYWSARGFRKVPVRSAPVQCGQLYIKIGGWGTCSWWKYYSGIPFKFGHALLAHDERTVQYWCTQSRRYCSRVASSKAIDIDSTLLFGRE